MAFTPQAAADLVRPDSLFRWEFLASSGDSWGGMLVADTGSVALGSVTVTSAGRYTILLEEPQLLDLSSLGFEDGAIFVEWYWDARSNQFLPTRNGPGQVSGLAGLGSEVDAAWTGREWATFGRGGLEQADGLPPSGPPATARFGWIFDASGGDRWSGVLFDLAEAWQPGDLVTTVRGRYRIVSEAAAAADSPSVGTVQLTGVYFDSASNGSFTVQATDPALGSGLAGLGSEVGVASTPNGLAPFGLGGDLQFGENQNGLRYFPFAFQDSGLVIWSSRSKVELSNGAVLTGPGQSFVFVDGRMGNLGGDPMFDGIHYAVTQRDVFAAQVPAEQHFKAVGWREGRDPNAFMSTLGYYSRNPDVLGAGVNPVEHYSIAGWREGRDPAWNFDQGLYRVYHPDVAAAGIEPLLHFLLWGAAEGRKILPAVGQINAGFDAEFYLLRYPDIGFARVDPEWHYRAIGWWERRDPNAYFDTAGYLSAYPDVRAAGIDPLWHYMVAGWREGRDPSTRFDTEGYLSAYPDIRAAGVNPFAHFLTAGIYERRGAQSDGMWG